MSVNKVVYNGKTLVDMTGATATALQILSGYSAYGSNGEKIIGTASGDRLKLRVLGGMTTPANLQENDIWVQTDVAISGWEFSETQNPTWAMGAGFVYFTSTYSGAYDARNSTGLNFLNQNTIYTKLLGCYQYNGSAWSKKYAYIYHNGGWNQFSSAEYYITYAGGTANYSGGWTGLGNVTTIGSDIQCYVDYSWAGCQAFTNGSFNVTNYSKLYVNISSVASLRDQASFGLNASKPNSVMWNDSFTNKNNCAVIQSITSAGAKVIDISSLSGNYYFWCGQNGTGWAGKSGFTIDKIWLA